MKTLLNAFAVALAGSLNFGTFNALADLEVSGSARISAAADFDAPLSAHGAWIEVGSYGRCWRPAHVVVEWSPYCYGHWVWTDCGWYWASDEPWGWACYHYGYWVYDPVHAWIWIPGIEWGPAWVSWRVGGGYIGWAPLAPAHVRVAAPHFVFVDVHRFREPLRPSTVIVNNTTIIHKTTVVNNIKRETRRLDGSGPQKVVVNEGPGVDVVQRATGKKVEMASIRETARQTPAPAGLRAAAGESGRKERPAIEQPKPATEVDKNKQPPAERVGPQPQQPPGPPAPAPKRPSKFFQEKGGLRDGRGEGKAREQGPHGPGRDKL
jgi:uncharacterized protein DUF6600